MKTISFVLVASTLILLGTPLLSGQAAGAAGAPASAAFVQVSGVREFSGWMIARPVQVDAWTARGLARSQAAARVEAARRALARFQIKRVVAPTDEYIIRVPSGATENQLARGLMATGNYEYVEPDWILYPIGCPNDSLFGSQWHHQANRMDSCAGWDIHTGNPSVGIGICDTGVRTSHEDLQLHRLEGYNAVDQKWESQGGNIGPVHPHGTMTTGCAAANGNNGVGVSGVGWNLSHRMMRVSNSSSGNAFMSDLQLAARTSIEAGDRVASVSYSGADSNSNLTTATYIKSIGGLLIWAAGNDGRQLNFGNRDADDLIVVGATDEGDASAWFSAWGQYVDITAPGVNVLTTDGGSDSSYAGVDGTSFSTPLTAGLCGLIWSADPSLTPDEVESILKQGADDLGSNGADNVFGYGRINVFGSLSLTGSTPAPPVADFSGTPTSGTAPLAVAFSDLSSGAPDTWLWDFGDGGSSVAQNPSHTYSNPGTYSVSLTASNANGSDTLLRSGYISVAAPGNPPTADFTGAPTAGTVPLTVSFADQSTGAPTSWTWDFGDGGSSSAQNPSHTYQSPGTYSVALTATNADGSDTRVRTNYITVDPAGGPTGEGYILSRNPDFSTDDRSFTRDETIYMLVWSDRVDFNDLRKNRWEMKDGSGNKARQPLVSQGDGTYAASFALSGLPTSATTWTWKGHVEDNSRVKYRPSDTVIVSAGGGSPPTANFSGAPTSGTAPLTVNFSDQSTGGPTSWSWDFGDGGSSSAQNPSHVYANTGSYTVTLTATNASGSDTFVRSNYITVSGGGGTPPVADFSGSPTSGTAPLAVNFTDLSSGGPTSWSWDFGDGGASSQQNPGHTYNSAGLYTVTLTVTNADGSDTRVRANYISVGSGGGFSGEGFILSRNPDFSTDDRSFNRGETIYMLVWSDRVDFNDLRKHEWELKDANKNKVKQPLASQGDFSYVASFNLSGLPSNATSWTWKGKVEDNSRVKYKPSVSITVNP